MGPESNLCTKLSVLRLSTIITWPAINCFAGFTSSHALPHVAETNAI